MLVGMVAICVVFVAAGLWPSWLSVLSSRSGCFYMLRLTFILLRDSLGLAGALRRREEVPSSARGIWRWRVRWAARDPPSGAGGRRNRVFRFAPLAAVVTYFIVTYQLAARGVDRDLIKLVSLVLVALTCLAIVLCAVRLNSKINQEASKHNPRCDRVAARQVGRGPILVGVTGRWVCLALLMVGPTPFDAVDAAATASATTSNTHSSADRAQPAFRGSAPGHTAGGRPGESRQHLMSAPFHPCGPGPAAEGSEVSGRSWCFPV